VDKADKRVVKQVMASPEFERECERVAEVRAERQRLEREVAEIRAANPERAYAYDVAKATGRKDAQEFVHEKAPDDKAELREYMEGLAKSRGSAHAVRARELLDEMDRETPGQQQGRR
jgi:dsRNA-specific ribonuclease